MRALLVVMLVACTSSDPAPVRDAGASDVASEVAPDGGGTCTLTGGACVASSGECCAQQGTLYDEARECLTNETRVIGCGSKSIPVGAGCIQLGMPGCVITHEGSVRRVWFTASQSAVWEPEERCPEALAAKVGPFKRCE